MSNQQQFFFHGGPLDGQIHPGPVPGMGRNPNYFQAGDNGPATIRADKGDQAMGRGARTGSSVSLYLLTESEENGRYHHYAWLEHIAAGPAVASSAGYREVTS